MINWFKRRKTITIAEQLSNLQRLGIKLKENVSINDCLTFDRNEYEERPYIFLLMSMGSEIATTEDEFSYPSDNVWYFDRECIEGTGDYVRVMERIVMLTKDEITVTDLRDYVDIERNIAWVSFKVNGTAYKFNLFIHNDWVSIQILESFSELLKEHGSSQRFFFSDIDQSLLVVLIQKQDFENLNQLLNIFIPASLNE